MALRGILSRLTTKTKSVSYEDLADKIGEPTETEEPPVEAFEANAVENSIPGAFQSGEIELDASLNNMSPDRYYIATRVDALSNIKLIIGGRSNAGGPIFSLVDPKFFGSDYDREAIALGFGGLLGASEYPVYWETLSRLGTDKSIALVWNGSEPYVDFMLDTGLSFDYLPRGYHDSTVEESLELVAESVIIETYWPSLGPMLEYMRAHPPTGNLKRFLLGTPPPLYSNEVIKSRLAKEPFFAHRAKDFGLDINDVSISRPELRRKLWFTLQTTLKELADQTGWHFIAVPEDCFDEKGYLKPELSAGDCVHANADFGMRVNREIFAAIKKA